MITSDSSCNNKEVDGGTSTSSVCEVNDMLQNNMTTDKDKDIVSICANCGKEGSDVNNTCNKCKQVKYCNAACKKKHRHKHKKECAEHMRLAAELHDEKLFKQPPPLHGDCPICFIRMPTLGTGNTYMSCCGKRICNGCLTAPVYDDQGNVIVEFKCPFCRTPPPASEEEEDKRLKKRMEANDPIAIYNLGCEYSLPQDSDKALEFYHRAAELGYPTAYNGIGVAYDLGEGVEVDKKKAKHYYELAAIGGQEVARYNLGLMEKKGGDMDRALKHFIIAARSGDSDSLKQIQNLYSNGHATKKDYMKGLQSYQTYLGEIKSFQRNKAAVLDERCRYYESGI